MLIVIEVVVTLKNLHQSVSHRISEIIYHLADNKCIDDVLQRFRKAFDVPTSLKPFAIGLRSEELQGTAFLTRRNALDRFKDAKNLHCERRGTAHCLGIGTAVRIRQISLKLLDIKEEVIPHNGAMAFAERVNGMYRS